MAEGKATTIRFAEGVYGLLEKASAATGLTINSIVVVAVLDWLEQHPPELAGRSTRGFALSAPRWPAESRLMRRVEPRLLPWPASPRAFDQFSRTAQAALLTAQKLAEGAGAEYIGTAHLLRALRNHGLSRSVLMRLDVTTQELEAAVQTSGEPPGRSPVILPSSRVKAVLRIALDEAEKDGLHYVGTEHLLLGIVLEGESTAARLLAEKGATEERIRAEVEKLRSEEEG